MIQPMMCAPRNRSFLSGIASRISFDAEEKNQESLLERMLETETELAEFEEE